MYQPIHFPTFSLRELVGLVSNVWLPILWDFNIHIWGPSRATGNAPGEWGWYSATGNRNRWHYSQCMHRDDIKMSLSERRAMNMMHTKPIFDILHFCSTLIIEHSYFRNCIFTSSKLVSRTCDASTRKGRNILTEISTLGFAHSLSK